MTVGSTSTPPRWQAAPVTTHLPANATEERAGGWNFADIWEARALRFPDAIAQVQGTNRSTWSEFDAAPMASPQRSSRPECRARTRSPTTSTTARSTPARPRRGARPLGLLVDTGDHVVGRDVEQRDQARTPATQPAPDHDRLARFLGGDRHGRVDDRFVVGCGGRRWSHVRVPTECEHAGDQRRRPRRRARVR